MSSIISEFEHKIKQQEIAGLSTWILNKGWKEREELQDHLKRFSEENNNTFSTTQNAIVKILQYIGKSPTALKEIDLDLGNLSDLEIDELLIFHNLEKPNEKYKEIKRAISSPESFLTRIPYVVIKELYERKKVPFDRQIFVACLIRFNVWGTSRFSKELSSEASKKFDTFFPQDPFTLDILLAVFEMELGVDGSFYMERDFNIAAIIITLVKKGALSKEIVQQKIFDAFNNPTLKQTTHGWAKKVYAALDFSIDENIKCQNQLIELLHNDRNLLVNFGIQQIKKISKHKSFNWEFYIDSLDAIVYRKKLTGGLKMALGILFTKLKITASLQEKACIGLAPIFLQEENALQLEATKCFALLKEPNHMVSDALSPFLDVMHSEAKTALDFLIAEEDKKTETPFLHYQEQKYTPASCIVENEICYIENEDDFIFLCSKVIKSTDAIEYELFLEALVRFYKIKDTHKSALQAALKGAKKIANNQYIEITSRVGIHQLMAAKLICLWLDPNQVSIDEDITYWKTQKTNDNVYGYTANRWLTFYHLFTRIKYISTSIANHKNIVLLSTPTHLDGSIHPTLFFERLQQYHSNIEPIQEADFNLALCRLNRWTNFKSSLKNRSEHSAIVTYLLDDTLEFDPTMNKTLDNHWHTAFVLKNPQKSINATLAKYNEQNWWNSASNWTWNLDRRYNGGYSWPRLNLNLGLKDEEIDNFSHSHFVFHLLNEEYIIADAAHWFFRDMYQLELLYISFIKKNYRFLSDIEASEGKSIMEILIQTAKKPVPLEKAGNLFLCLSLFCGNTPHRNAALDWLLLLIEKGYLNLDLFTDAVARMICNEHYPVPIKRVTEQFDQLLQMGGVYVDVLHKTLEAILKTIDSEDLPKSFKNILHHYYEVLNLNKTTIPDAILLNLNNMVDKSSIKREIKKLLLYQEKIGD